MPPLENAPVLFVCGMSRSGTTLLATLFDAHPRIAMGYELLPVPGTELREIARTIRQSEPRTREELAQLGREVRADGRDNTGLTILRCARAGLEPALVDQALSPLVANGLRVVESLSDRLQVAWALMRARQDAEHAALAGFKLNIPGLSATNEMFPNSYFVCIVRDPRDVVASHRRRGFNRSLEQICQAWTKYVAAFELMEGQHPDRVLIVRYETIATDPATAVPAAFARLPVPFDPRVLGFAKSDAAIFGAGHPNERDLRRGFFRTSVGRWKTELGSDEIAEIRRHCDASAYARYSHE